MTEFYQIENIANDQSLDQSKYALANAKDSQIKTVGPLMNGF